MPLPFRSKSHGVVAFGFFNIECDLLLLERRFFLAEAFCQAAGDLAAGEGESVGVSLPGWHIETSARVGDLRGAIRGTDLSGFIGATYTRFPFPADPSAFRQQPAGALRPDEAVALLLEFGAEETIPLEWERGARRVSVADVEFEERHFGELLAYVRRGGYPRWRDDAPPAYVRALFGRLERLRPSFAP